MTPSKSFLDTTVFADRLFGTPAVKRRIAGILAERPVCATKYVREQFRATFLRAAVLVHNQLRETGDAYETLRRTDEFPFFTRGDGVKARKVLVTILQCGDTDDSDKLATLERLIEVDMLRDFDGTVKLKDDTSCCRCPDLPTQDENGFYHFQDSCSLKQPRPCRIEDFWKTRSGDLTRLATIPAPVPPNKSIENVRQAAAEVIAGKPPRGKRCSVHLSDPVIVAEADPGSVLVTSNVKDFEPLARALESPRTVATYR